MTRIAIVGGGPAGYEAALVAAELGSEVTLVEQKGPGGSCVLDDCVPSKTLIATSEAMTNLAGVGRLGVHYRGADPRTASWDDDEQTVAPPDIAAAEMPQVNSRVLELAQAQSQDIGAKLTAAGVRLIVGTARLRSAGCVEVAGDQVEADAVLIATGAHPRVLEGAEPDADRILTWRQLYGLVELPERLIVVGSGVTGAEFANAYLALGANVTLVTSRERVLPGEDVDAAQLLQKVFVRRGMQVVRGRAARVARTADGVRVDMVDGSSITGSHVLMAVGSVPTTAGLGLEELGVRVGRGGFIEVDRVSRTSVPGVYSAGDVTGVLMLASVAAMQGRIAMWHALGEAVTPLRLSTVSANVFTDPEISQVGVGQRQVESGEVDARSVTMPLHTNARAKMLGISDGFVKLFCRPGSGAVLGGVVCAPRASELILPISLAVNHGLTVDQMAQTFSIYPSLSGSVTEAARRLMVSNDT